MTKPIEKKSLGLVYDQELRILDQTQLPWNEEWLTVKDSFHMVEIIQGLKVRGAPLIGVAAAIALACDAKRDLPNLPERLKALRAARPTAVNLMNAMDRMTLALGKGSLSAIMNEAFKIFDEEEQASLGMSRAGQAFITKHDGILTHCNTGGLATVGLGTALSIPILANKNGMPVHVYVDETRPLLQGARLNTWELQKHGVPHTLICDNMAGSLMASGKIQRVFVGADRIALNGDFANKIGTYSLAVLAHHHRIPFYVVAPVTTIDHKAQSGLDIPIEERTAEEVHGVKTPDSNVIWAAEGTPVWNPAFDCTPVQLITALITDKATLTRAELENGKMQEMLRTHGI